MTKKYYDITIALAGICQSANLVQQLAHQGSCNQDVQKTLLNSIIQTHPQKILDIFGHESQLKLGLEGVVYLLNTHRHPQHVEFTRYVLSLIVLAKQLLKNGSALALLGQRINLFKAHQLNHFDLSSDNGIHTLASIYADIISPMGKRIQVFGNPDYLQQPVIQDKVRANLLAGIRCAILWQQVGGSKWQFVFSRKSILNMATRLLQHC